MKSHKSTH